jgi:hypothetical protein
MCGRLRGDAGGVIVVRYPQSDSKCNVRSSTLWLLLLLLV